MKIKSYYLIFFIIIGLPVQCLADDDRKKIETLVGAWASFHEQGDTDAISQLLVPDEEIFLWGVKEDEVIKTIDKFKEFNTRELQEKPETKIDVKNTNISVREDYSRVDTEWSAKHKPAGEADWVQLPLLTGHLLLVRKNDEWYVKHAYWSLEKEKNSIE